MCYSRLWYKKKPLHILVKGLFAEWGAGIDTVVKDGSLGGKAKALVAGEILKKADIMVWVAFLRVSGMAGDTKQFLQNALDSLSGVPI